MLLKKVKPIYRSHVEYASEERPHAYTAKQTDQHNTLIHRVYRFTRHEENVNPASSNNNDEEAFLSQQGSQGCCNSPQLTARPATSPGVFHLTAATSGRSGHDSSSGSRRNAYPNSLQPWKPPLLFQFCKVCPLQLVCRMCASQVVCSSPTENVAICGTLSYPVMISSSSVAEGRVQTRV